jgi:hypothetical protein
VSIFKIEVPAALVKLKPEVLFTNGVMVKALVELTVNFTAFEVS